ncbi:MAG: YkgJ family cysteine cluster protein [Planctomycetes bacterium]|nr:YkgJ family cysteine cluster protein [Planctomycetota bacterium]
MGTLRKKAPWYAPGLAFECRQCGRCCEGPEEGYVWVSKTEIAAIARYLGTGEEDVRNRYVRRVGRRYSLIEQKESNDCIFLVTNNDGSKKCRIYAVRPQQCRTWPFWPSNLTSPEAWSLAHLRCPGINHGKVHPLEEIEAMQSDTSR